jgi:hypothetical protein
VPAYKNYHFATLGHLSSFQYYPADDLAAMPEVVANT